LSAFPYMCLSRACRGKLIVSSMKMAPKKGGGRTAPQGGEANA
jgi:hypothetical protein